MWRAFILGRNAKDTFAELSDMPALLLVPVLVVDIFDVSLKEIIFDVLLEDINLK